MRAFAFVVAGAVVLCHPAGKALAVSYSVTDLGTFGFGIASRVNNNGQVAGRTLGARAAVFSNGTMSNIGAASGYQYSCASGVNASGQVVGYVSNSFYFNNSRAFLYTNGLMTSIPGVGFDSVVCNINDSGQVAGWYDAPPYSAVHGFLYSGGTLIDLGPGGATDINTSGQVVGWINPVNDFSHAFIYSNGTLTDLGRGGANGINASGQAVGSSFNDSENRLHAVLWSNGAMTDLSGLSGGLGTGNEEAEGINAAGQIVGYFSTPDNGSHAFLYDSGSMIDLNTLIPADSGFTLQIATSINDSGQIVGYGVSDYAYGQDRGFLLTPTPEPSSFALLAAGAIGFAAYSWRRWRQAVRRQA